MKSIGIVVAVAALFGLAEHVRATDFRITNQSTRTVYYAVSEWKPYKSTIGGQFGGGSEYDAGWQVTAWFSVEPGKVSTYVTTNKTIYVYMMYDGGSDIIPGGSLDGGKPKGRPVLRGSKTSLFWNSRTKKWCIGEQSNQGKQEEEDATSLDSRINYVDFYNMKANTNFLIPR